MNGKMGATGKEKGCCKAGLIFLTFLLWAWVQPATASQGSASSFFKGKTVRIVVGLAPGGGFDTFARLLARHFWRHIPGHPKMIVQNVPGAGSLVAANRVYAMQPGDGLTIVTFHFGMVTQALVGDPAATFDPMNYHWLGEPSIGGLPRVLWVRADVPVRSLEDLKKRKEPLALGATGVGTGIAITGEFLRHLGYPVKNVHGYGGARRIMAALERKEVDGVILSQASVLTLYRHLVDQGLIRPVVSLGTEPRVKPLEGLSALDNSQLNPQQREVSDFLMRTWRHLRLFAVPPGTPPERVRLLQEAFLETLKSPKLISDAQRQGVTVSPLSGDEIMKTIQALTRTSPEIIETYKGFLGLKK